MAVERSDHPDVMDRILKARAGDREAMESLVLQYRWLAYSVAGKYRVPGGTKEDLRQEALLGIMDAVRAYDPAQCPFSAFVTRCINSNVLDALKAATRRKHTFLTNSLRLEFKRGLPSYSGSQGDREFGERVAARYYEPEKTVTTRESLSEVASLLKILPHKQREAVLGVANGRSYATIAESLGCSTKSVDNAVQKGRRRLQEEMKRLKGD